MKSHLDASSPLAAGLKGMPDAASSFAATMGAWRFLNNESVTLPALVAPLRAEGIRAARESASPYALLVRDWSKLAYGGHASKTDQTRLSHAGDVGYELATALLIDAADGSPLAPLELELLAADGLHTTRSESLADGDHPLRQILPAMREAETWGVPRRLVHVIDAEADSAAWFRQWNAEGHLFLVRTDFTRKVRCEGELSPLPDLAERLWREGRYVEGESVAIRGRTGRHFVAEAEVELDRPARMRTNEGRKKIGGPPLKLRLILTCVLDDSGEVLAEWYLLTNVPADVDAQTIATWYYWRWRIETFHKLLKSAGHEVEAWLQRSASAVARRLLVAAMACVLAWRIERAEGPQAEECRRVLVRLSGRQTKRSRPVTTPALLAGLGVMLPMLALLEEYSPAQLRRLVAANLPRELLPI